MVQYNLILLTDPRYQNLAIDQIYDLDREQLQGLCTGLYLIFGYPSAYVGLYQVSGMRKIDYQSQVMNGNIVLLEKNAAIQQITADRWILDLADLGVRVTRKYSMRVDINAEQYIIQFNQMEFLSALVRIFDLAGLNYSNHLFDLHENGTPISIGVSTPTWATQSASELRNRAVAVPQQGSLSYQQYATSAQNQPAMSTLAQSQPMVSRYSNMVESQPTIGNGIPYYTTVNPNLTLGGNVVKPR